MTRIKNLVSQNKPVFLAFIVPVVLLLIGFAITGIYPFGDQQIAVIDMYHQYQPFLAELQDRLKHGGSLFHSWNGAAGFNFWTLIAYYGASPLNLLLVLFPIKHVGEAITFILVLRLGLASAFMAIYLRSVNKRAGYSVVAFSTCYALCSYVMGYFWCIMWMDAVMLLPLIMLGLNQIIHSRGCVLYTVTLALVVFSNYYIAIMVCIFIAFYFPVAYFSQVKWEGARACVNTTCKAIFFSLLAVAMAAVMLYPTYLGMQNTYYISSEMPDTWSFYNNAMDILNQLLPNAQLTFREGLPNLYCGLPMVILGVYYVLSKTISTKEKALNLGFLGFLFLSLNINVLNFIWHGFHFPNQLPYRYTFVISFILITMAYKAFTRLDEIKVNAIWGTMAAVMAWMILSQKLLSDKINDIDLYLYGGVALLIMYSVVLVLYRKRMLNKKYLVFLLILIVSVEMGVNVTTSFKQVGNTSIDTYYENYDDVIYLAGKTTQDLARTEIDENHILNCPALYHYKGVSQFSSSINANATSFMEQIGVEGEPGKNRYNYNQTNPVTNAILNIKYLIGKNTYIDDPDFQEIESLGESTLYENKYPLGMGYVTSDTIYTWDSLSSNPFEVLDDYVRAATDNKVSQVFNSVEPFDVEGTNMELVDDGFGFWQTEVDDTNKASTARIIYEADATQKYYVFVEANSCESIMLVKEDQAENFSIRDDCGSVVNAGVIQEGDTFTVEIEYEPNYSGSITCYVCTLDYAAWDTAYDILSQSVMEVTDFGDSYIKGTVDAKQDGVFVASIINENGWTMKVDGQVVDLDQQVGDALISVPMSAGTHEIELKFRPPGIIAGAIITLLSILILIVISRKGEYLIRKKDEIIASKRQPVPAKPEESQLEESDCNTECIDSYPEEVEEGCPD